MINGGKKTIDKPASYIPKNATLAVVGAGIVGVCCALNLQRVGYSCVLIDRLEPGEATSFGNAGILASHSILPNAMPGIARKIPGMLMDPAGPVSLRWPHALKMLPWFWKFMSNATPERVAYISDALAQISVDSVAQHLALAKNTPVENLIKTTPLLEVYRDETAFRADNYAWNIRKKHGAQTRILKRQALADYEPALSQDYSFGVLLHDYGFVLDPSRLVKGLAAAFQALGGRFKTGEVVDVELVEGKAKRLVFAREKLDFDGLVIAAGAWSAVLTRKLGHRVPLETERGYHITLTDAGVMPVGPILPKSAGFIATPMAIGLRLAGLVEFGGLEKPPASRHVSTLLKHAKNLFPDIRTKDFSHWLGFRSTLPDSLPVIGKSPRHDNVFLAFGHQHLGLTQGPKTGKMITDLVQGAKTDVDLTPFRIDRF